MKILITGSAGQDGRILGPKLGINGHQVVMLCRPSVSKALQKEFPELKIVSCDLTELDEVRKILDFECPDAIVNLAAFSSVKDSWNNPELLKKINIDLPAFILEWIRTRSHLTRLVHASSSEIFGSVSEEPQNEETPLRPLTPYGHSKAIAHDLCIHYRHNHNLSISNAIFYNHESFHRSNQYVTRHISMGIAAIQSEKLSKLNIGSLSSRRDWGWADEYMHGVKSLLESGTESDYVFATGMTHSVEDLLKIGFSSVGISDFRNYIEITQSELRQVDPVNLCGDSTKARNDLGWEPRIQVRDFLPLMILNDLALSKKMASESGT